MKPIFEDATFALISLHGSQTETGGPRTSITTPQNVGFTTMNHRRICTPCHYEHKADLEIHCSGRANSLATIILYLDAGATRSRAMPDWLNSEFSTSFQMTTLVLGKWPLGSQSGTKQTAFFAQFGRVCLDVYSFETIHKDHSILAALQPFACTITLYKKLKGDLYFRATGI